MSKPHSYFGALWQLQFLFLFSYVILGDTCNSDMDPFPSSGKFKKGHRPQHVLHSTEMLALTIPVPALLGTVSGCWVWSQLAYRGLVLHSECSLVSANLLSVFHGQFLKGPVWLNKSLDNSRATSGSGLRDSCSQSLPCANREPKLNSNWEISWENDPMTTGNRHLHWRWPWNQVNH